MYVTYPLSLGPSEVWLLVDYDDIPGIDAFRLGINTTTGAYATFPPDHFHTDGLMPVARRTGEPVPGFIWASTADLAANPVFPGHHDSTRRY